MNIFFRNRTLRLAGRHQHRSHHGLASQRHTLSLVLGVGLLAGVLLPARAQAHQATLKWTDSTDAGCVVSVYRGTATGQESATALNATPVAYGVQTYVDTTVAAGQTYYYVVKCTANAASSNASNEAAGLVIPLPPSNLSITIAEFRVTVPIDEWEKVELRGV